MKRSKAKGAFQSLLSVGWERAAEQRLCGVVCGARRAVGRRLPAGSAAAPLLPQVVYGVREYARTAVDMISRRTRLAFLNVQAAEEALPRIVDIMGKELNWSEQKKKVPRAFFIRNCFVFLK